jgi:hypothetical protein
LLNLYKVHAFVNDIEYRRQDQRDWELEERVP